MHANKNKGARLSSLAIQALDFARHMPVFKPTKERGGLETIYIADLLSPNTDLNRVSILFVVRFRQYLNGLPDINGVAWAIVPIASNLKHQIATVGFWVQWIDNRKAIARQLCLGLPEQRKIRKRQIRRQTKLTLVILEIRPVSRREAAHERFRDTRYMLLGPKAKCWIALVSK